MSVGTAAAVGIGVAGAGILTAGAAGIAQAGAASDAADAQSQVASASIAEQKDEFAKSLDFARSARVDQSKARDTAESIAQPSAQELGQLGINLELQNNALSAQIAALNRNNDILESVDPAVKEAGKQALELLQGKTAAAVQPLIDQRSRQRSQLEQTLADRLGPDYAQSSAGAAALRNFDNDTSAQTNQVQQQTLGQLLGVASNASNNLNPVNNAANAYSSLGSLNAYGTSAAQNIVGREVNAFTGNPVTQQLQYNPVNYGQAFTAAGGSTVGAQLGAQAIGGIGNGVASLGSTLLGYGLKNSSSSSPTTGGTFSAGDPLENVA